MYEVTYLHKGDRVAVHLWVVSPWLLVNDKPLRVKHPLYGMTFSSVDHAESYMASQGIKADRLDLPA